MALQAGQLISARYRVVRILGQGGYGAVYLVQDTRLAGRSVALKESFDSSLEAARQFEQEATLLARLRHPSLPGVSDFFTAPGGTRFLVMDYVEGRDLTEIIQLGIVPPLQATQWLLEISDAVAYLHAQTPPIIHRDIKPANIKIRPDNRAVLVDFGIAKEYNPQKQTARIAKAVSTGFSPPEQYSGAGVSSTHPYSDVYALGATLYCAITRTVPPEAMDILAQKERLVPPRQLNPQTSPALEQVILKAMALNSLARYPTARELTDALRATQTNPVAAPVFPPPAPPPILAARVRCPRCAWENRAGAKFCQRCGHRFAGAPAPAAPAVAAPPPLALPQLSPPMRFELGNAYARRKDFANAVTEFQAAATAGFENAALYFNWGDALIELNRATDAVAVLQQGIAKYARDGDLHAELGLAYAHLGQARPAIQTLETALKYNPQPATYLLLGMVYQALDQDAQAIPHVRKFLDAQSDSVMGRLMLGQLYLNTDQLAPAQAELERVVKLDAKNEPAHWLLAIAHLRAKRYGDAAKWANKLIQLAPQNALGPYALGLAMWEQSKFKDALKAFQNSARLDPKDADAKLFVARCHLKLNQPADAKRELQAAARLDPKNKAVQELLSKL